MAADVIDVEQVDPRLREGRRALLLLMLPNFMVARMLEESSSAEQRGDDNATESGLPHLAPPESLGMPGGLQVGLECGRPVFCAFVSRSRCREGQATLDVGPNEVRTEQPCCYVARHISLVLGTCR